jgi:hypothetical protein
VKKIDPDNIRARSKVRPKSTVFDHTEMLNMAQWKNVVGYNRCRVCTREHEDVKNRRGLQNIPLCDACYKGLMSGSIDPILLYKPPRVDPNDTINTTKRQSAGKDTYNRALANARWIKCECGLIFRTEPYKKYYDCTCRGQPSHNHPPASEQWVRHATEFPDHKIADLSDRNPDGNEVTYDRLMDLIRMKEAQLEKKEKK